MKIETLAQLEEAKKLVREMKASSSDSFVISVFDEMLTELDKGDVENIYSPSFLSITRFGYDIFGSPLKRI
jgi:hypothetical protein